MKRLSPLLALALCACATAPHVIAGPVAGIGQIAIVGGLRIQPLQVVEDSRCPTNARCVWAGRIILRTAINGGTGAEIANLTLGEPLEIGGTTVTLVSAEPGTTAGEKLDPSAYRFTFSVQR